MDEYATRTTDRNTGMNPWRAGCVETRTSGSEGGPEKQAGRNPGTALRPDPYTRLATGEGVLWLASVRDAFANRIVGWATDPRATTALVLTALNHALRSREVRTGQLIFHSDKGAQYTALRFTGRLVDAGVAPSTGSTGDSFDNALAENLWSTIKVELVHWPATTFATRADAERTPCCATSTAGTTHAASRPASAGCPPTSTRTPTIAPSTPPPTGNEDSGKAGEAHRERPGGPRAGLGVDLFDPDQWPSPGPGARVAAEQTPVEPAAQPASLLKQPRGRRSTAVAASSAGPARTAALITLLPLLVGAYCQLQLGMCRKGRPGSRERRAAIGSAADTPCT
jgi:transposase InsO family protein